MNQNRNVRVLLAMSGGTDSSVAAMLLQEQGYTVVGLTLNLYGPYDSDSAKPNFIKDAEAVALHLGIEHHVCEASSEFETKVLSHFVNEYLAGRTPFPCVVCNPLIKWAVLQRMADTLECGFVATGHYARKVLHGNRSYVAPAVDSDKDQSFFLWNIPPDLLHRVLFPLGEMRKTDVRAYALQRGFESVGRKKDSMGICFIEGSDYRPYLQNALKERKLEIGPGELIDSEGRCIGRHNGYPFYTIGQRRGLNHGQNRALFVTEILPATNQVRLGMYDELKRREILVRDFVAYYPCDIQPHEIYTLKVRYRNQATPCSIQMLENGRVRLVLHEDLYSVAPGQAAVLFCDERVVGGGILE